MANRARDDAEYDTEVAVVGAGPGGTTLAYLLARSGVDVRLLERQRDLDRTFRGYLFQPLVLRMFDEMGVLDSVLELDHQTVQTPSLNAYGRSIPVFDFSAYDERYGKAVLMEQPPLLGHLIDRADDFDPFEYRDATTVQDLLTDDGDVVGVRGTDRERGEVFELRSRLVVGADGRYSTVRAVTDIDAGLLDSKLELVWFKLPSGAAPHEVQARFNDGGVLGYFGIGDDETQLGHFVEKGGYTRLRSAGIDAFHDRVTSIDPSLDGVVQEHVTDYGDTTLLNIEPGVADQWVDDGVLLLGDAAHVASPVGGQGNGLAIADAAAAHPVICEALDGTDGVLPSGRLRAFERRRRPTVEGILRFQRRGERALSTFVRRRDRVPARLRAPVVRLLLSVVTRSPLGSRMGKRFAWDSLEPVETSRFVDTGTSH